MLSFRRLVLILVVCFFSFGAMQQAECSEFRVSLAFRLKDHPHIVLLRLDSMKSLRQQTAALLHPHLTLEYEQPLPISGWYVGIAPEKNFYRLVPSGLSTSSANGLSLQSLHTVFVTLPNGKLDNLFFETTLARPFLPNYLARMTGEIVISDTDAAKRYGVFDEALAEELDIRFRARQIYLHNTVSRERAISAIFFSPRTNTYYIVDTEKEYELGVAETESDMLRRYFSTEILSVDGAKTAILDNVWKYHPKLTPENRTKLLKEIKLRSSEGHLAIDFEIAGTGVLKFKGYGDTAELVTRDGTYPLIYKGTGGDFHHQIWYDRRQYRGFEPSEVAQMLDKANLTSRYVRPRFATELCNVFYGK